MLICLQHEFKSCPAEKGKSLRIIMVTVKNSTVKKVLAVMGVYEVTFAAMDKSEVNGAVNPLVIIGDPEIII